MTRGSACALEEEVMDSGGGDAEGSSCLETAAVAAAMAKVKARPNAKVKNGPGAREVMIGRAVRGKERDPPFLDAAIVSRRQRPATA